jgi:hypothetical protein
MQAFRAVSHCKILGVGRRSGDGLESELELIRLEFRMHE